MLKSSICGFLIRINPLNILCVNSSGAGKTSILNVLFRLYDKESGSIFIKGVE